MHTDCGCARTCCWSFLVVRLQNLATMFKRLKEVNAQDTNQPHLLPEGHVALRAATEDAGQRTSVLSAFLDNLDAQGKRHDWATVTPSSMLLWPYDQHTAAVADLIEVSYNESSGLVSLEVDLVDNPNTISEFAPHPRQTLDVDNAHYHFSTRSGVTTDAQALLKSLGDSKYKVKGELGVDYS